jgi:hypothetical protein
MLTFKHYCREVVIYTAIHIIYAYQTGLNFWRFVELVTRSHTFFSFLPHHALYIREHANINIKYCDTFDNLVYFLLYTNFNQYQVGSTSAAKFVVQVA